MDHAAAQAALVAILTAMRSSAPGPWQSVRLQLRVAGVVSEVEAWVTGADGREVRMQQAPSLGVSDYDLREATYHEGRGAWYVADIKLFGDGRYEVDYDYDARPRIGQSLDPRLFIEDLEEFPRDEEHRRTGCGRLGQQPRRPDRRSRGSPDSPRRAGPPSATRHSHLE